MDASLIFVIIIMFYFCVVFPLQMRRYIQKRQQRLEQSPTTNHSSYVPSVSFLNRYTGNVRNSGLSPNRTDHSLVFGAQQTESRSDAEIAAARHLEAEHRQQIIDIQKEIERQAIRQQDDREPFPITPHMPPMLNSSTISEQQIINVQSEIDHQAIPRQGEYRPNAPHMPSRLINSSTIRSSIYTITSGSSTVGFSNSDLNYPYGPPITQESEAGKYIHRTISKDDELPSYDQAVSFDSSAASVTIRH